MAGFDFPIPVIPRERQFAAVLLRYLQRLSAQRRCQRPTLLRFAWGLPSSERQFHHYFVTVDGDFAELQAFSIDAAFAVLHFAHGYVVASGKYSTSRLPSAVPVALINATHDFALNLLDVQKELYSAGAHVEPNTYTFRRVGVQTVDQTLRDASAALLQWHSGKIRAAPLVEHLHTAAEITLKLVLGAPNRGTPFAALVSRAEALGFVSPEQAAALHRLKDQRRDAKHRGQGVSTRGLAETLSSVVGSLHSLTLAAVARRDLTPRSSGLPPATQLGPSGASS